MAKESKSVKITKDFLKKAKGTTQSFTPPPTVSEATEFMRQVLEKNVKEEKMTQKRYEHSIRVAKECKRLANIFHFNEDLAEFSGMVHDICKDMKPEEQEALVKDAIEKEEFDVTEEEVLAPKLWHGIAGAKLLQQQFQIAPKNILNAVRYHTVARKNMSVLEKIVYLADMTEEGRTFVDVHVLRAATNRSLDLGMYYALQYSIRDTIKKGGMLPRHTIEAYNQYVKAVIEMKD